MSEATGDPEREPRPEIAIAYDVPGLEQALELDARLGDGPEIAKVGLELFTAGGPQTVQALKARGRRVFLDLKLHDIPNTVRGAARSAARLGADLITVHGTGGSEMVAAAVEGAAEGGNRTRVLVVTVLTSLNAYNVPPGFQTPFYLGVVAAQLLQMAEQAGAHGIVCSAADLAGIRHMHGRPFFAATPGIRPSGASSHDQKRVTTVSDAVRLGSSMLVLGRAVTGARDPRAALEEARAERDAALSTAGA